MLLIYLVLAISAGFLVYCTYGWIVSRRALRHMTAIEKANARIEEAKLKDEKLPRKERLRLWLLRRGYRGDLTPFFAAVTFGYIVIALVMRLIGASDIIAVAVALPVTFAAVLWGLTYLAARRKRIFNQQLMQALTLVAAQVQAGNGAHRALEQVIPSLQDPLRSELSAAMDATVASKDLVRAMKDLEEKYPSRAFSMFIAALEIDQAKGGRLEPALRQAASTLQRDFELSQEAVAEISQTRSEFFSVIAIIGFVCFSMFTSGGETTQAAYFSFVGIVAVGLGLANFALGVWRASRIFSNVKGDV